MTVVDFSESQAGPAKSARAEGRVRLVDLCDEARAPVGFGCRAARCTTCRVEVLDGVDRIEPPEPEEAELLAGIEARSNVRLACQAVVREGDGRIALRWIGPRTPAESLAR